MSPLIIEEVVTQHAEDAAFLWLLRESAVRRANFRLRELGNLDERLEAHLDGLRTAGQEALAIIKEQLCIGEPGEVFVATVVALETGDSKCWDDVLQLVGTRIDSARAVIAGFGWAAIKTANQKLESLLHSDAPMLRRIGIAAAVLHRQDGGALVEALRDTSSVVRARALKGIGELGLIDHIQAVRCGCEDSEQDCRFYSVWSGTLLGDRRSIQTLRHFAEGGGPHADVARLLYARAAGARDTLAWHQDLALDPAGVRAAIQIAGALGDPVLVPWLIEQMASPPVMRIAGEAMMMITGLAIDRENLDVPKPEGFESGPNDDPRDDVVEVEPDEDLPYPNQKQVERWWSKARDRFQLGVRHLLGLPISESSLSRALREGNQRQRAAAALELVLLRPGRGLFNVRAPAFRQVEALR